MNKFLLYRGVLAAACAIAPLSLSSSGRGAEVAGAPAANHLPINLAQGDLGTRLEVRAPKTEATLKSNIDENDSAQALISEDAALTYPLQPGQTSLLLTLSKIRVLNSFNFVNFGAAGKYTISVSSTKLGFDAPGWKTVSSDKNFDGAQVVSDEIGTVEGRYVRIDFNTAHPGRISGLGLFGTPVISSYEGKPLGYPLTDGAPGIAGFSPPNAHNVYFDLANLDTGAHVVAVSRGGDLNSAQTILDGNVGSNYTFDATDPAPTVVVDLGVRRAINRLSCVYNAPPGRLDFYLVDNPYRKDEQRVNVNYVGAPGSEPASNDAGAISLHGGRTAVYSVDTSAQPGLNRLATDVAGMQGRFLVAEFHPVATASAPDFKDRDFKDRDFKDRPDFKDSDFKDRPAAAANAPGQGFQILSLSAFGQVPSDNVVPQFPPTNVGGGGGTPQPPVLPPGGGVTIVTP